MKALQEIKERAEALEKVVKKAVEGDVSEFTVNTLKEFARYARRDIPRLCEALEFLLPGASKIAVRVVEQILSGTTEKGKDAGKAGK